MRRAIDEKTLGLFSGFPLWALRQTLCAPVKWPLDFAGQKFTAPPLRLQDKIQLNSLLLLVFLPNRKRYLRPSTRGISQSSTCIQSFLLCRLFRDFLPSHQGFFFNTSGLSAAKITANFFSSTYLARSLTCLLMSSYSDIFLLQTLRREKINVTGLVHDSNIINGPNLNIKKNMMGLGILGLGQK